MSGEKTLAQLPNLVWRDSFVSFATKNEQVRSSFLQTQTIQASSSVPGGRFGQVHGRHGGSREFP